MTPQRLRLVPERVHLGEGGAAVGDTAAGQPVPGALGWKYCGGGFGGYAVYLFLDTAARDAAGARPGFRPIEPYVAVR